MHHEGSVDPNDPQATKLTLALLAAPVGIGLGLHDGLVGLAKGVLAGGVKALGPLEQLVFPCLAGRGECGACHF